MPPSLFDFLPIPVCITGVSKPWCQKHDAVLAVPLSSWSEAAGRRNLFVQFDVSVRHCLLFPIRQTFPAGSDCPLSCGRVSYSHFSEYLNVWVSHSLGKCDNQIITRTETQTSYCIGYEVLTAGRNTEWLGGNSKFQRDILPLSSR